MRPYPDRQNTMALLAGWQLQHAAVSVLMKGACAVIGIKPEGRMHTTVWNLFDAYSDGIAIEIGDEFEWLDWYRFETDMGKRAKSVEINGKTRRIKTLAQLCTVILEERKHKEKA